MYKGEETDKNASRPAVLIAMTGIAIGLAVMIITVAIIVGFKQEIRNKIVGFSGHAQISNLHSPNSFESLPIMADNVIRKRRKRFKHLPGSLPQIISHSDNSFLI